MAYLVRSRASMMTHQTRSSSAQLAVRHCMSTQACRYLDTLSPCVWGPKSRGRQPTRLFTAHAESEVELAHGDGVPPVPLAVSGGWPTPAQQHQWQKDDVLSDGSAERLVGLLDSYMAEHGIRDTSNTMPFTLYIQLSVPLKKVVQFERWVARLVVAQSQSRPGYQGTLLYRPEEIPDAFTPYQVFVLDFKYLGAENLRSWLRSRTRASRLAKALRLGLWLPGSAEATIAHGRTGTLDNVWRDLKEDTLTNPVLSRWKLVGFSAAASWLVAMSCAWPHATVGALLTHWHCHPVVSNVAITFLIVALSVYVAVPYLQQYFMHLLAAEMSAAEPASSVVATQPDSSVEDSTSGISRLGASVPGSSTFEAGQARPLSHSTVDRLLLHDTFYDSHYDSDVSATVSRDTDNFSIVVTHRVRPGLEDKFETAAETLELVISDVIQKDFIGITIIRPRRGCTAYSIIMQFDTRAAMDTWLCSEERRRFMESIAPLLATASQVKLQDFSTVDLLMSDYNTEVATTPPSQWKTVLIVTVAVMPFVAFSELVTVPWLKAMGIGLPWIMFVTTTFNTVGHAYTTTPILSSMCSEWLHRSARADMQDADGVDSEMTHPLRKTTAWLCTGLAPTALSTCFWFLVGLAIGQRPFALLSV